MLAALCDQRHDSFDLVKLGSEILHAQSHRADLTTLTFLAANALTGIAFFAALTRKTTLTGRTLNAQAVAAIAPTPTCIPHRATFASNPSFTPLPTKTKRTAFSRIALLAANTLSR